MITEHPLVPGGLAETLVDASPSRDCSLTPEFLADLFLEHHAVPYGGCYVWDVDDRGDLKRTVRDFTRDSLLPRTAPDTAVVACAVGVLNLHLRTGYTSQRYGIMESFGVSFEFVWGLDDGFTNHDGFGSRSPSYQTLREGCFDNHDPDSDYCQGYDLGVATWDLLLERAGV